MIRSLLPSALCLELMIEQAQAAVETLRSTAK